MVKVANIHKVHFNWSFNLLLLTWLSLFNEDIIKFFLAKAQICFRYTQSTYFQTPFVDFAECLSLAQSRL